MARKKQPTLTADEIQALREVSAELAQMSRDVEAPLNAEVSTQTAQPLTSQLAPSLAVPEALLGSSKEALLEAVTLLEELKDEGFDDTSRTRRVDATIDALVRLRMALKGISVEPTAVVVPGATSGSTRLARLAKNSLHVFDRCLARRSCTRPL